MKLIPRQSREYNSLTKLRVLGSVLSLSLLTACGGSGAGDSAAQPQDNTASMAVEPVVGVWNLPGNWNGENNDQAYLVIRSPDNVGVAEAIVFDFDDERTGLGQNCYFIDSEGSVMQSEVNQLLFMDISPFPDAIVSLNSIGSLVIVYTVGASTSTDRETNTLVAERLNIAEPDAASIC